MLRAVTNVPCVNVGNNVVDLPVYPHTAGGFDFFPSLLLSNASKWKNRIVQPDPVSCCFQAKSPKQPTEKMVKGVDEGALGKVLFIAFILCLLSF